MFAILLVNISSGQTVPKLNDSKENVLKYTIYDYQNTHDKLKTIFGLDSVNRIIDMGDSIICKPPGVDDIEITYIFINEICSEIKVKFACVKCLDSYRSWLFKRKWRWSDDGFFFNNKIPAKAYVKRAVNCPYLFEITIFKVEHPLDKRVFKKMKKANKAFIKNGWHIYIQDIFTTTKKT
jgi:hypothetical protein